MIPAMGGEISRAKQGWILFALIFVVVYAVLAAADLGMESVTQSSCAAKFPKWLGCVLANHENLAGGLIGGSGALFGAWLAWSAVREQIEGEGQRQRAARNTQLMWDIRSAKSEIASLEAFGKRFADLIASFEGQPQPGESVPWPQARAFYRVYVLGEMNSPTMPMSEPLFEVVTLLNDLRQLASPTIQNFLTQADQGQINAAHASEALHEIEAGMAARMDEARMMGVRINELIQQRREAIEALTAERSTLMLP